MKCFVRYIVIMLIATACLQAGCQKNINGPASGNLSAAEMSKQMAVSLYKSLSGQYGGADINDGIKAPLSYTPGPNALKVTAINPYCGMVIDTTYDFIEIVSDTVKTYFGHYRFTYGCTNNVLDSYTLDDSISNSVNRDLYAANYKLTQKYYVKALDQTYKLSSVEGAITFSSHASLYNKGRTGSQYHNSDIYYKLKGVRVDISSGMADVIQGEAGFTAHVNNLDGNIKVDNQFYGTITFLSNQIARVLINLNSETKIYTVNMVTGKVTAG
ncbi:MAG: hypothetical protein V4619_18800 [Bacteroidota bacterium]